MIIEWLYLLILCSSLIINIIIVGFAWTRWTSLAGKWYIAIVSTIVITLLSFILFSISENRNVVFFWVRIRFFMLSLLPYLMLGFIAVYTGNYLQFKRWRFVLLIVPIMTTLVVCFAPHLLWESWDFQRVRILNIESAVYTGWFSIHSLYSIGCFLSVIIIALRSATQTTAKSRRQLFIIVIAILLPVIVVILPVLGVTRGSLNPFPISLSLSVLLYGWALLKEGLLRLSPLAYFSIIENMKDAVYVFDIENCLVLLNQSAAYLIEIEDRQSVIGKHAYEVFLDREDMIDQYKDKWDAQLETTITINQTRYILDVKMSPIVNSIGENEFKLLVVRDITQAKQAEEAVRRSESQYRSLFEQQNDAVFIVDPVGKYLNLNQQAAEMIGYTMEEALQLSISDVSVDFKHSYEIIEQLLAKEVIPTYEKKFRHKDGHIFPIEISVAMVWDNDGKPLYIQSIVRDISERKQAEMALRDSERQFRALFEQSNDAVLILDIAGNKLAANQRSVEMTGYPLEDLLKIPFAGLSIEKTASHDAMDYLLKGRIVPPYERKIRHKDGHIFIVEINAEVVHGDDGNPKHIQCIMRDISERKQAETILRESEMLYRSLFQQPNDGVFTLTMDGRYISVNERGATMFGYTMEEALQLRFGALAADNNVANNTLTRLLARESLPPYERLFRHKEGYTIPVEVNAKIVWNDDNTPKYVQLIVRDITDRKEAETAIRDSEERQSALIRAIPDMIFVIGKDGTVLNLLLPPSEELVDSDSPLRQSLIKFLADETTDQQLEAYHHVLKTREIVIMPLDTVIDGQQYHFEARIVALNDDEVISIVRDMTEIRQAQQHEIDLALEKERHELLTTFIQDASHEFRTPLSIISTNLYIMTRTEDPEKKELKVQQINDQVQRINDLVGMMLKITQLDKLPRTMQPLSILPLIQSIVSMWQSRSSVPIHPEYIDLPSSLLVIGDYEILQNAFSVIINNAVRFGDEDNVIDIRVSHTETFITVSITDKAAGIPKEDIPYIFDAFWRGDTAHTTPGLGLGLSMAQKIIKLHNGIISVESEVGKGSRFDIVLPIIAENT